jgi:hypothetical protein
MESAVYEVEIEVSKMEYVAKIPKDIVMDKDV